MRTIETSTTATVTNPEPWVDLRRLSQHLGFSYGHVQKMVKAGLIPGKPFKCGKQIYCRFKLSAVDAFIQGANVER